MSGQAVLNPPPLNQLYDAASGATFLKNQEATQTVGANDIAMTARAAAPLLGMSEEDAAAAYPGVVANLRANGFGQHAPSTYPGHATTAALVQRGMTVPEQYDYGLLTSPAVLEARRQAGLPLPDFTGGGGGGAAPGGTGAATSGGGGGGGGGSFLSALANIESGDQNIVSRVDTDSQGRTAAQGGNASEISQGNFQINTATWRDFAKQAGVDVNQYPNAMSAPREVQAQVASVIPFSRFGPRTQQLMRQRFGDFDSNRTVGDLAGLGPRTTPAAGAGAAPTRQATAPAAPPPQYNPAAGPRIANLPPPAPANATVPVAPSPTALRTGGTDVAGPAAGPDTLPPVEAPNRMYQTGLPGITISANPLAPSPTTGAPPGTAVAAVTPPPSQQPPAQPPPAARPVAPATPAPATGQNSPQFQAALELNRRAAILESVPDKTGVNQRQAAALRAQAQLYMQADSVVQTPQGQVHTLTGKIDDPAKPLPHYVYDPNMGGPGVGGFVDTTGTNKPEFEPAQRDTAVAQQTVMVLGPKIAAADAGTGPPVTPEDRARYNVAATTYQQFKEIVDPVTKQVKQVPTRPLPDGLPQPPSTAGSRTLTEGLSPAQQQIEQDPAAYEVAKSQYTRDAGGVDELATAGRQAQADQVRIKEMQDVLQRFSTGPGTDWRTAATSFLQRWAPSAVSGWEKQSSNLSGNDAAQAFSKLALVGAGTQERGVLGARGGYQAIKLFKEANPNVDLNDATNKSILDMQMISNQANQDYTQKALSHFADNETKFAQTHKYDSLAQFDRNWNAQRNPQVYSAAMGAISGQPVSQWADGLSGIEYERALGIVSRANPSAVVNGKSGRISMQPTGQTTATTPPATQATAPATTSVPPPAQRTVGNSYPTPRGNLKWTGTGWVAP